MSRRIAIFDTTLRDGEQSPGCSMNLQEKVRVALQLERLGVDVVEAGFAIASADDFEAVRTIAKQLKHTTVASLARATKQDIDTAFQAIQEAKSPRIHTFIATSDLHMQYKLKMTEVQVLERAIEMVKYAKHHCHDIEFSAEDASRTRPEFLYRVISGVIKAGATVINIPDTVGYTTPDEYYKLITGIREHVAIPSNVILSVHCHNDLGLAVANSLAAVRAGATQIECTVNGIGERAGNAALEEIVMALATRKDIFHCTSGIDTTQLYPTSRLVTQMTGAKVARNKAIVGDNAFAHESGIHQHGMLQNSQTYEIMTPESIGLKKTRLVLGKHSGRHAVIDRLKEMGYQLEDGALEIVFEAFKALADKKKQIDDRDLAALVEGVDHSANNPYDLVSYVINTGNAISSTASVVISHHGTKIEAVAMGFGPVDAGFKAIDTMIAHKATLEDYQIQAITEGQDAQGEARVTLRIDQQEVVGKGISIDILEASLHAYIDALNRVTGTSEHNTPHQESPDAFKSSSTNQREVN